MVSGEGGGRGCAARISKGGPRAKGGGVVAGSGEVGAAGVGDIIKAPGIQALGGDGGLVEGGRVERVDGLARGHDGLHTYRHGRELASVRLVFVRVHRHSVLVGVPQHMHVGVHVVVHAHGAAAAATG